MPALRDMRKGTWIQSLSRFQSSGPVYDPQHTMNSTIIRTPWPWIILAVVAASLVSADRWPHVAVVLVAVACVISGMGIQRHQTGFESRR